MYNQGEILTNTGNLRETFFFNQISKSHLVKASKQADFFVSDKYTFEIGGKGKNRKQILGLENAFVVKK